LIILFAIILSLTFVLSSTYFTLFDSLLLSSIIIFLFYDTATTAIYTLSLHDALPILLAIAGHMDIVGFLLAYRAFPQGLTSVWLDRKSTRLNSSHVKISYAVFCLKKKKNNINI